MNQYSNFIQYVRRVAKSKQTDTAWIIYGNSGDPLMQQVDAYEAGAAGVIPDFWVDMYKEYANTIDPEYQEYIRLRNKFNKTGA
jgi:hypothetical protein